MRFVEDFVVVNGNRSFSMTKYPTIIIIIIIIQQYLHFRIEKKGILENGQTGADTFHTHWFFITCFAYSQSGKKKKNKYKEENRCNDLKTLNKLGFIYKTTTYRQRSEILKLKCVSTGEMVHVQCSMLNVQLFRCSNGLKY